MVSVSFKLGKTGTKYCPKSLTVQKSSSSARDHGDKTFVEVPDSPTSKRKRAEVVLSKMSGDRIALSLSSTSSEGSPITSEHESSFAVNLFLDGFSIGKPTEKGKQPPSAQELTTLVHPYDRTSETLFQAIDGGWLPGDIHEDMPCKYVNGCVICEVRDYRKGSPISGDSVSSGESFPVVQKVLLRPTMENIVKDISSIAEDSWTYSDLMEIESRILKAVRPKLCLDPTPMLEMLCENLNLNKLNLGVPMTRRQRMQKGGLPEVRVLSHNSHGKKVSIDKATENAKSLSGSTATTSMCEDSSVSCIQESAAPTLSGVSSNIPAVNSKIQSNIQSGQDLSRFGVQTHSLTPQTGLNRPRLLHGQGNQSPISPSTVGSMSFAPGSFPDWSNTFVDPRNAGGSVLGKRDNVSMLSKPEMKKPKQELASMDKFQQQNTVPKLDTILTRDPQRRDNLVPQDQNNETVHFSDVAIQSHPQHLTGDDDQQVTSREVSLHESKLSPHLDQRSTGEFKVKEEVDFQRGQIAIERESEEVERNKENKHSMVLDNEQSDQKQISQRSSQQHGKPSFPWQSAGQFGQKDQKRDDLLQKTKLVQSPRELQKSDVRGSLQSPPLSKSGELSQPLTSAAVPTLGSSYNNLTAPVSLGQQREKQLGLTAVNASQLDSQHQQLQPSVLIGRRKSNPLPKIPTASGVASPGSVTNPMTPSNVNSPSTGTAPMSSLVTKIEQPVVPLGQNKHLEKISKLVSVIERHGLVTRKKKKEEFPEVKKQQPYWPLLSNALASDANNEDQQDVKGQRSMANSLVGGGVNVRKTRIISFERTDILPQGAPVMQRRNRVRLVMCERGKDGMVEAVVQFGDDLDDDMSNSIPHDILPLLPNTHYADMLAIQFCALMVKDGYKLTEDQVQPILSRQNVPQNASSIAQPMAPGGSTLGGNINQLQSSPHLIASQNMPSSASVCGIPPLNSLQLSSANTLAAVRMPPPGNNPNRQLSSGFLQNGLGTSSKALLHDASQLTVVQQQQHQMQQHQPQFQRSQHPVTGNHLPQPNVQSHISNQQMNSQIMNNPNHVQYQISHQRQPQFQRKVILPGGLNSLASMGVGNMNSVNSMSGVGMPVSGGPQGGLANMGLSGMNNVVGMGSINGISASMGGISNLTNTGQHSGIGGIGQSPSMGNGMGLMRPFTNQQTKSRMAQGRGRPGTNGSPSIRNPFENLSGISVSNQTHNSVGLAMLGHSQGRGNMSSLQRAPGTGMHPPKIGTSVMGGVPGQNLYLNQQLSNQSQVQQINSQQQLNQQPQLTVQQQVNLPQPTSSQQPLSSQPLLNVQQQMNQQQQLNSQSQITSQQQLNPQQLNSQLQLNPQQMSAGNLVSVVGCPTSPQLSSQTLASVGSITSSPMELQSANRGNSMTTGQ